MFNTWMAFRYVEHLNGIHVCLTLEWHSGMLNT